MHYHFLSRTWGKPVVLTGAQIPLSEVASDGRRNFINAVRVATEDIAGVYIVFDEEIIMGARASKVSESKLDAYETVNWDLAGEIRVDIRLSEDRKKRDPRVPNLADGFETNIAVVTLFPGFTADDLEGVLTSGIKGMLLRTFGSGKYR